MENKIGDIINQIVNGIELPSGETRPFDILDFYLCKGINHDEVLSEVKEFIRTLITTEKRVRKEDIEKISVFLANMQKGIGAVFSEEKQQETFETQIFEIKDEYNTLRDTNGFPIPGTGITLTNEEKQMMLDFLKENNVPYTRKMYEIVRKRYITGELDLSKTNEIQRKV